MLLTTIENWCDDFGEKSDFNIIRTGTATTINIFQDFPRVE
jgi:hypothetical protein